MFRSNITVEPYAATGSDLDIARAAWVDSERDNDPTPVISRMMEHRHGTPFEHGSLTVVVECPIFVAREWFRHRVGWSYNEVSQRYRKIEPEFWIPRPNRPLIEGQCFRPMRPEHQMQTTDQYEVTIERLKEIYAQIHLAYTQMLDSGVAREVARTVLPVGTYTAFFATCNPRSLMHFISLRVRDEANRYETYPQLEIQEAAKQLENLFASRWPITYDAFVANGRVAP